MLVDFLINDDFYIKMDVVETERTMIKYSIQIKQTFYSSDIVYSDNLWLEEKTIEDFVNNLSVEKKVDMTNVDNNVRISLDKNFLDISINKKKLYNKNESRMTFKVDISDYIDKFKEEFSKLKYFN